MIDYRSQRFEDVVADLDLVFDTVGGETWERSWDVLRPGWPTRVDRGAAST